MNHVSFIGTIDRCQLRATGTGQSMLPLSVKITEKYQAKDGTLKESSDYLDVVFFGDKAKMLSSQLFVGCLVSVTGKLKKRKVDEKVYTLEISPEHIYILSSPPVNQQPQQPMNHQMPMNTQQHQQYHQYLNGQTPYHPQQPQQPPTMYYPHGNIPPVDDDLPF